MDKKKLEHYRSILMKQLRERTEMVRDEQNAAIDSADDGVMDSVDMSLSDANKDIAFHLGERESQMIADIDQALLRIDEGSYGDCARCGKPIDERRLDALPTARYDAACQAELEAASGEDDMPTL